MQKITKVVFTGDANFFIDINDDMTAYWWTRDDNEKAVHFHYTHQC